MRYLKIFESFTDDVDRITSSEYFFYRYGYKDDEYGHNSEIDNYIRSEWVALTEHEIEKLDNLLTIPAQLKSKDGERCYYDREDHELTINKMRDDWYLISCESNKSYRNIDQKNDKMYFRCNGWVGLLKCVKYLKNKCKYELFKNI